MSDSPDPEDYDLDENDIEEEEDIEEYVTGDELEEFEGTRPVEEDYDEELTDAELSEEIGADHDEGGITNVERQLELLKEIDGVGAKTAEKLVRAGFDDISKIASTTPETLAERVAGLSLAKAQSIITSANAILEEMETESAAGITKHFKRKKAEASEPEHITLPPTSVVATDKEQVRLITGFDIENRKIGVKIGPRVLTKFERARVIGARALQISMGAPPLIDTKDAPQDLFSLAERELKAGVLPMTVRRTLPTGEYEDIPLSILLKYTRLV